MKQLFNVIKNFVIENNKIYMIILCLDGGIGRHEGLIKNECLERNF